MNVLQAIEYLQSPMAFERAKAAQWLAEHATADEQKIIADALRRETVPQVRRHLELSLQRARTSVATDQPEDREAVSDAAEVLEHLANLIHHETEPAIGWVRLAAIDELKEFEGSETEKSIELLRRRLDGVAEIARSNRRPTRRRESLVALVEQCLPRASEAIPVNIEVDTADDDTVNTDGNLFTTIMANALSNAVFASRAVGDDGVHIAISTTKDEFAVIVTNRFEGSSFSMEEMGVAGVSTRTGSRGLGILAMKHASARLGYSLSMIGSGGVAVVSIKGARANA